jgi:hypothetical protein
MLAEDTAAVLRVASMAVVAVASAAVLLAASTAAAVVASMAEVAVASTVVAVADPTVAAVTGKKTWIPCKPGCFGSRAFLLPEAWPSRMTFEEAQHP